MLERLRGIALLRGFHGAEPVDVGQLADAICRLSELGTDLKERIAEIDVNPLICSGGQVVAADASFVLRSNSAQS